MAEEKNVVPTSITELGTRISEVAAKIGGKKTLANMIGISESQLYRYINGSSSPTVEPLLAIAKAANISIAWLITGEESPSADSESSREDAYLAMAGDPAAIARKDDQLKEIGKQMRESRHLVEALQEGRDLSAEDIELLRSFAFATADVQLLEQLADRLNTDSLASSLVEEFALIPGYNIQVAAGAGSYPLDEKPTRHLAFRRKWLRYKGLHEKDLALVFVHGDSMEPTISDNNTVMIDTSKKELHDGAIYVLRTDNHLIVKRVQRLLGDDILLISDNKAYQPISVDLKKEPNFQVIGKVEWIGKDA